MADHFLTNAGSGGLTFASDEDAGPTPEVHYPILKLAFGALNTFTLVSTTNPLPVDLRADNLAGNIDINIAAQAADIAIADGGNSLTVDNNGTFAAQVDSLIPGVGATNLGKAVDSPSGATDTGVALLGIRDDALAALVAIEGDYVPFRVNNQGAVWFKHDGNINIADGGNVISVDDGGATLSIDDGASSITVDNGGTFAVQVDSLIPGVGATNLGKAVNAVAGAADVGIASLAVRDDALTTLTPIDGDYVRHRVNNRGALWTKHDGDMNIADGGNSITVDDGGTTLSIDDGGSAITVDNAGTFAVQASTELPAAAALADNVANPTVPGVGAFQMLWDSVTWDRAPGDSVNGMLVNLGANNDISGTVTADAGTNLNTSALALEGGGNLATLAGAVTGTEMQCDIVAALPAGTNAIGKLAANTGVDIGDVDVLTLPARAATADNIGAALMTNVIHNGTTALTPKFAKIDAVGSGDNTLVASVASKKIRVLAGLLVSTGTVNARFESGAAGTALSGQMNLVANTGFVLPFNPVGWCETAVTTLLNLELSAAVSVDGMLVYVEV